MGSRILLAVMAATIAGAVIGGFAIVGSPAAQRERRMDERRGDDLTDIELAVVSYRQDHDRVPASIDDLGGAGRARDPLTSQPYEYRALDDNRFELCATFQQPANDRYASWRHDAGRQCFVRTAGRKDAPEIR